MTELPQSSEAVCMKVMLKNGFELKMNVYNSNLLDIKVATKVYNNSYKIQRRNKLLQPARSRLSVYFRFKKQIHRWKHILLLKDFGF